MTAMLFRPMAPRYIQIGDFDLDVENRRLSSGGIDIALDGEAMDLLIRLAHFPGAVLGSAELERALPGVPGERSPGRLGRAVESLLVTLQNRDDQPQLIESMGSRGYRLNIPEPAL